MHEYKDYLRTGLIVLLALSIILSVGISNQVSPGYAQQPFQTLPPAQATFQTPIGPSTPVPTPLPTVGPGQYFEAGDGGLPEVTIVEGDGQFGYGTVEGNDDLIAVWVTDESGTHYRIVHKISEILFNELDPDNGFVSLIRQRNKKFEQISLAVDNREVYKKTAKDIRWGSIVLIGGAAICLYFTLGSCIFLVGLGGGGFWASIGNDRDANIQQNSIRSYKRELEDFESRLIGGFQVGDPNEPKR